MVWKFPFLSILAVIYVLTRALQAKVTTIVIVILFSLVIRAVIIFFLLTIYFFLSYREISIINIAYVYHDVFKYYSVEFFRKYLH